MAGKIQTCTLKNVNLPRLVTNIEFSIRYYLDVDMIIHLIRENNMIPVFPSVVEIYLKLEPVLNLLSRRIFRPICFCLLLVRHTCRNEVPHIIWLP
jgi:hypothetical protein